MEWIGLLWPSTPFAEWNHRTSEAVLIVTASSPCSFDILQRLRSERKHANVTGKSEISSSSEDHFLYGSWKKVGAKIYNV
jgi:hypothetical protein